MGWKEWGGQQGGDWAAGTRLETESWEVNVGMGKTVGAGEV